MRQTNERTGMRSMLRSLPIAAAAIAAVVIGGCGGSSSSSTTATSSAAAKAGGTVTVLEVAGGVDSIDPGYFYYQADYTDLGETTQRTLYGFGAKDTTPQPDLATALPVASNGGKTQRDPLQPAAGEPDRHVGRHQVRDGALLPVGGR